MTNTMTSMKIKSEYLKNVETTIISEPATAVAENDTETKLQNETKENSMDKKKQQQHKKRTLAVENDTLMICNDFASFGTCALKENCKYSHDMASYLARKENDLGKECVNITLMGYCPYGLRCRYLSGHPTPLVSPQEEAEPIDILKAKKSPFVSNHLGKELMESLRKKTYRFPNTEEYFKQQKSKKALDTNDAETLLPTQEVEPLETSNELTPSDALESSPVLLYSVHPRESKKIDFTGKLYLAPLTTVGNLPFRRICKEFGVDITCGEMALSMNLLKGNPSEWALTKRHASEDIFGVQICGGYPDSMAQCAELIQKETNVDFIDVNMGCPIDLIFEKGMGSALLDRPSRIESIVKAIQGATTLPLTVKIRTGVYDGKLVAHKIIPKLKEWGVSAVTLHGRTRQQRYTKEADWDYITECAVVANGLPFLGNGDIMTFDDYDAKIRKSGASGILIARGALIKPWLFTEIKEKRHWDISSTERLAMLKKYCGYGLEHFGTDTEGINKTRRFLLEWLSFLYRYVPVGLLEVLPQRMNDRPPQFIGRNELESLMASAAPKDWIQLTEMLLGPVPSDFYFEAKHKSNSYQG